MRPSPARVLLLGLLVLGAGPAPAPATTWACNARFGFALRYPAGLLAADPPPAAGDAIVLRGGEGTVEVRAEGAFTGADATPPALLRAEVAAHPGARWAWQRAARDGFALSGTEAAGDVVFYARVVLTRLHEAEPPVLQTLRMRYPAAARARWDPVLVTVAGSFRRAGCDGFDE